MINKSDALLAARAGDLAKSAAKREFDFVCSRFLSPAEQAVYLSSLQRDPVTASRAFFWGGTVGCDRRVCVVVPSYIDLSDAPPVPTGSRGAFSADRERFLTDLLELYAPDETCGITPLRVKGSSFKTLSHRDYMGSILALGIEREVLGDIALLSDSEAVIFASDVIAPYLLESLSEVGRDSVKVTRASLQKDFVIPRRFQRMTVIAASPRADAIVGGLAGVSRADAKELCLAGKVEVCYVTCYEGSATVSEGDTISVRGVGKFIIDSFEGETRSGRMRVSVRKYL